MTTTSRAERKKAKTRFAIIYVVSLMLLFVIMSAFWKKFGGMQASVEPSQAAEKEAYFIQLDTLLHRKMEQLDDLYTGYVRARKGGSEEGSNALFSARADLGKTLDSIDQQAAFLNEGPKKKAMTFAASLFRKAVEDRDELMNGVLVLPKNAAAVTASVMVDSANIVEIANLKRQIGEREAEIAALRNNPSPGTSNNNAALAQLQTVVTEKDRQIALLQTQLKQRPAVGNSNATVTQLQTLVSEKDRQLASLQTQLRQKEAALKNSGIPSKPSGGGAEWQQKYTSLKSSYDRMVASEKSLKNAYQTVADDNRRLLVQLQSMRKN